MLDSDKRDLPHGALNKAQSDFSSACAIYLPEAPQDTSTASTPVSPSPPESPMDIDMSLPSDLMVNSMEHISSLELALCSNFTCCSIQLPDLHALVEHFEEKHVVVFNLDGMRIYPENSGKRLARFPPLPSLSHSPSSSRSSSVVSSPQTPTTPLATSLISPETSQKSKPSTSSCVYTPFNMSSIPDEPEYGIGLFDLEIGPDPYPIISCSPYDGYPDSTTHKASCSSSPNSKSHDPMVLDSVDSISVPNFGVGVSNITSWDREKDRERERERDRERERKGRTKADIVNATAVSAKNAVKAKMRITGGNVKRREKAYRCPKAGCTKSYLNPNGLKYHLEKGTCQIEDSSLSTDSDVFTENTRGTTPMSHSNTTSTAAPIPNPSLHSPLVTTPTTNGLAIGGNNNTLEIFSSRLSGSISGMSIPTPPATPGSDSSPVTSTAYRISSPTPTLQNQPTSITELSLTRPLNTIPC